MNAFGVFQTGTLGLNGNNGLLFVASRTGGTLNEGASDPAVEGACKQLNRFAPWCIVNIYTFSVLLLMPIVLYAWCYIVLLSSMPAHLLRT